MHDGEPIVTYLTPRDFEIFKLLSRYPYLPADYIHAIIGGGEQALRRRLGFLSRKPNLYLNRPDQQYHRANANYRQCIYELDSRGANALEDRGIATPPRRRHRSFPHELMAAEIMASLEIGVRGNPDIRFISWADILAHPATPEATKLSASADIPVTFVHRGAHQEMRARADAEPFGIERTINGKKSYLFFPGIEADCATEPIEASDFERSSIYRKFAAYLAIAEQGLYRSHFGFPNFFVPIITTGTSRMRSMMTLLERITDGKGSKMFLFKTHPHFASYEPPRPAGGHMLTEPWQRVGHEPLSFDH
jgi:hypothetical protein